MKRLYTFIAAALAIATASAAQPLVKAESAISAKSISDFETVASTQKTDFTKKKALRVLPQAKTGLNKGISRHRKAAAADGTAVNGTYLLQGYGAFWSDSVKEDPDTHKPVGGYESSVESLFLGAIEGTADNKVTIYGFFDPDFNVEGTYDPVKATITIPAEQQAYFQPVYVQDQTTGQYVENGDSVLVQQSLDDSQYLSDIVLSVDITKREISYMAPNNGQTFNGMLDCFYKEKGKTDQELEEPYALLQGFFNGVNSIMAWTLQYPISATEFFPIKQANYIYAEANAENTKVTVRNLFAGFPYALQNFSESTFDIDYIEAVAKLTDGITSNLGDKPQYIWDIVNNRPNDTYEIPFDILSGTVDGQKISGFGKTDTQLAIASETDLSNFYAVSDITIQLPFYLEDKSGIEDVTVADENAPVEYFNLQGVRVANPEKGLYIKRQGKTVTKVLVK